MRTPRPARTAGPSQRQLRAGELVRHELAEIFARGEVHDAELPAAPVTITEVRMTPDLKQAIAFCAFLGRERFADEIKMLNAAATKVRGHLGRRLTLKYTPVIQFRADESFAEGARIDALLRDIRGTDPSGNPSDR